jgi:hypothetical protein
LPSCPDLAVSSGPERRWKNGGSERTSRKAIRAGSWGVPASARPAP